MHPRERVLEEIKLRTLKDKAIPLDLAARAHRLGLLLSGLDVRHPKQTSQNDEQGDSNNGNKTIFPNL